MKLCADILYWRLKEELTGVLFHGRKNSTLILNRPEFYLDRSQSFEENSVYVCSADHLPQTPELGENVCLVCLGEHWNLNAYYERCSVILIHGSQDIFRIFNLVQEVFNQYDTGRKGSGSSCAMVQLCLKCWMPAEASLKIQCCL